jgi:hypothetical protein
MGLAADSFNMASLYHQKGDLQKAISLASEAAHIYSSIGLIPYAQRAQKLIDQIQNDVLTGYKASSNDTTGSIQIAVEAFQLAASIREMRVAVSQYHFMVNEDFIHAIEHAISGHIPIELKPAFQKRLSWLKEIAHEQEQ